MLALLLVATIDAEEICAKFAIITQLTRERAQELRE